MKVKITTFILFSLVTVNVMGQGTITHKKTATTSSSPRNMSTRSVKSSGSNRQAEINKLLDNMIYVQGGTFTMGATNEQGSDAAKNEKPTHQVTVSSFYICKYEVTIGLWRAVMGKNPSSVKGDNYPANSISWNDCQEFINKLNSITGKKFRMPTEAEWEFAARGGTKGHGYKYSGSNDIDNVAWFYSNSNCTLHKVGLKYPNELDLYDMSGNVEEWCADLYGNYSNTAKYNPNGAASGSQYVSRGGTLNGPATDCRNSCRSSHDPDFDFTPQGMRLAMSE